MPSIAPTDYAGMDKSFLVICTDLVEAERSRELRAVHLQAHLRYVEKIMSQIQVAGPMITNGQKDYQASCFIYKAVDADAAKSLLQADPYFMCGLYQSVSIQEFRPVVGEWVGGKKW